MIDLPPPNAQIVCIETQPDYPPGTHMLTIKTLRELSRSLAEYDEQNKTRNKFEERLLLPHSSTPLPDDKMGIFVTFKRDCKK